MSTQPEPWAQAKPTAPPVTVPYGPPATESSQGTPSAATVDLTAKSVARTAGSWALRALLVLAIRAIFRGIFRG